MHLLQKKILELTKTHNLGYMTLREIGVLVDETPYPQKIKYHLDQLKKKGLIQIDKSRRSIKEIPSVCSESILFYSVPILGSVNCGETFDRGSTEGYLKISKKLLKIKKKNDIFAFRAIGHSLNLARVGSRRCSIEDGDFVIIDGEYDGFRDGDYVLSIIDGYANVRRLIHDRKNKQIVLASDSTLDFPPIYIHQKDKLDSMINGKVIDVIKKPKKS